MTYPGLEQSWTHGLCLLLLLGGRRPRSEVRTHEDRPTVRLHRECFGAGEKPELCGVEIGRMGLCGGQGSSKTWFPLILFI